MFRQAILLAGQNFSGWYRNARVWLTFSLSLVMCFMLSDQMLSRAQIYDSSVQIFEPFIWTFGDAQSIMISTILLILLFADIPFAGQTAPYCLIRTKRSIWLAGQMMYAGAVVVIYDVFILTTEILIAAPWSYIGNVWSETSASMAYAAGGDITVPVSLKTMESSTPYECMGMVLILMLLYSLFLSSLMLFLNLTVCSAAGVIGAIAVNLYGYLLDPDLIMKIAEIPQSAGYRANVLCGWLSLLNHAAFPMHDFGYDHLPGIRESVILFVLLTAILSIFSVRKMRSYDFLFQQVEE